LPVGRYDPAPLRVAGRDDRVLAVTRVVSAAIVPVLTAAFVILFFFPGQTHALWGWTIKSRMSAMFMGGGYLAGALFFARAARATEWHRLGPGFVATTVFATLLGVATFVDWDQFNHTHVSFWAWTALYVVTPLLLPWLYVRNRAHDPRSLQPGDVRVPDGLRRVVAALGGAQLAFALVLFVRPSLFQARWPWPITPLTARSTAGFAAFPAVAYLAFAFESRWSALRWPFETAIVGVAFIGLAAARSSGNFRPGGVAWAWRAGLVVAEVFLVGVWLAMRREVGRARPPLPSAG
jgi:hypothetical protein